MSSIPVRDLDDGHLAKADPWVMLGNPLCSIGEPDMVGGRTVILAPLNFVWVVFRSGFGFDEIH